MGAEPIVNTPSQTLSPVLLKEISTWDVQEVSGSFFHGCRSDDLGVDVPREHLAGPKWLSVDRTTAGSYAWFYTRDGGSGSRHLATVHVRPGLKGVVRPRRMAGLFPDFLQEAFPHLTGYALSRELQRTLLAHLHATHGADVNAFVNLDELLIPQPEIWAQSVKFEVLPSNHQEFLAQAKDV